MMEYRTQRPGLPPEEYAGSEKWAEYVTQFRAYYGLANWQVGWFFGLSAQTIAVWLSTVKNSKDGNARSGPGAEARARFLHRYQATEGFLRIADSRDARRVWEIFMNVLESWFESEEQGIQEVNKLRMLAPGEKSVLFTDRLHHAITVPEVDWSSMSEYQENRFRKPFWDKFTTESPFKEINNLLNMAANEYEEECKMSDSPHHSPDDARLALTTYFHNLFPFLFWEPERVKSAHSSTLSLAGPSSKTLREILFSQMEQSFGRFHWAGKVDWEDFYSKDLLSLQQGF